MPMFTIVGGVNGAGKSSLSGVLKDCLDFLFGWAYIFFEYEVDAIISFCVPFVICPCSCSSHIGTS